MRKIKLILGTILFSTICILLSIPAFAEFFYEPEISCVNDTVCEGYNITYKLENVEKNAKVQWSISDKSAASLTPKDNQVTVLAKKTGSYTITALYDNHTYIAPVNIGKPRLNYDKKSFDLSQSDNPTWLQVVNGQYCGGKKWKWSSSDTKVISVKPTGAFQQICDLTPQKKGKAVVTASCGKYKLTCQVTVTGKKSGKKDIESDIDGIWEIYEFDADAYNIAQCKVLDQYEESAIKLKDFIQKNGKPISGRGAYLSAKDDFTSITVGQQTKNSNLKFSYVKTNKDNDVIKITADYIFTDLILVTISVKSKESFTGYASLKRGAFKTGMLNQWITDTAFGRSYAGQKKCNDYLTDAFMRWKLLVLEKSSMSLAKIGFENSSIMSNK